MAGVALGYGVALSKDYLGGLYAGANIGYCYRISSKSALYIAADVQFQQAKIEAHETIEDVCLPTIPVAVLCIQVSG